MNPAIARDRPLMLMVAAILLVVVAALSFGQVGGFWLRSATLVANHMATFFQMEVGPLLESMSVILGGVTALQGLVMLSSVLTLARVRMLALFPSYLVLSGVWGATFRLQAELHMHWSVFGGLTGSLGVLLATVSLIYFSGVHEFELDAAPEPEAPH